MLQVEIKGAVAEELGGLPFLKKSFALDEKFLVGTQKHLFTWAQGPFAIAGDVDVEPDLAQPTTDDVDFDLKFTLLGETLYDVKKTLAEHIASGPITIGGGQLKFTGTITITEVPEAVAA